MTVELICWVILLMIGVSFTLAVVWFMWTLDQAARDNEVSREMRLTRYTYDENGNPVDYFHPATGMHFIRPVGNSRWPAPTPNFIVGNSPVAPVQREKNELPMTVFVGGKPKVSDPDPKIETVQTVQQLEASTAVQSADVPNERDFVAELSALKGERVGKERAVLQVTGVRKGGSPAWRYWSSIYDQLA